MKCEARINIANSALPQESREVLRGSPWLDSKIGNYRYRVCSRIDHLTAIGSRDAPDRDQWLSGQTSRLAHSGKADYGVRVQLARRPKDWPDCDVVGRCLVCLSYLLGIVGRNTHPALKPNDFARTLG